MLYTNPLLRAVVMLKNFDYTAMYTGMTEHALKNAGITNYKSIFITPFDHAYFYPGVTRLNLKNHF